MILNMRCTWLMVERVYNTIATGKVARSRFPAQRRQFLRGNFAGTAIRKAEDVIFPMGRTRHDILGAAREVPAGGRFEQQDRVRRNRGQRPSGNSGVESEA